jgi:hypothetical protein
VIQRSEVQRTAVKLLDMLQDRSVSECMAVVGCLTTLSDSVRN